MSELAIRKIYVLFVVVLFSNTLFSQSFEDYVLDGDESFGNGDFLGASIYYKNALSIDSSWVEVAFKYAEACRLFNNYKEAEHWYEYVFNNDVNEKFLKSIFWLAEMNKNNGNYVSAGSNFSAYYNRFKNKDDYFTKKAKNEVEVCKFAIELMKDTLKVKIEHLDKRVNTPYSEFGAVQLKDSVLLFSSMRLIVASEYKSLLSSAYLSKIYNSKLTIAGYSKGREIESKINSKNTHTANIALSDDFNKVYFTRCNVEDNILLKCELYVCEKKNGKWQKPKKLNNKINLPGYTATQPALVAREKEDVLYFVSDRPGGHGKLDIWFAIIKDGVYHEPTNLGSIINTPGNEISPFFNNKSNSLFFSSDWHPGLGGFDIFYSRGGLSEWTPPKNAGFPLNTSYNDMYYTINHFDSEGYFTSNRPGSFFIKGETCCNDIFYYEFEEDKRVEDIIEDTIDIESFVKQLLPLTLYFHNDEPDPATEKTSTEQNYKATLAEYFLMKEKYKKEYSRGLKGEQKKKAIDDIESFFNDSVGKGFIDLEKFSALLLSDLTNGSDVKINIKGYTSPLNTREYNIKLAKRRISSLKNYIIGYDNGVFLKYLNGTAESYGKLELIEEPIGEEQASKLVSDNINDKRNSIYSRAAALERRIQIILYSSDFSKAQQSKRKKLTKIEFLTKYQDLGEVKSGEKRHLKYYFQNIGKNDLKIQNIEVSCGCTAVDYPKYTLKPGEKGVINVTFDSKDRKGTEEESLIITANVPGDYIVLNFAAFVVDSE